MVANLVMRTYRKSSHVPLRRTLHQELVRSPLLVLPLNLILLFLNFLFPLNHLPTIFKKRLIPVTASSSSS